MLFCGFSVFVLNLNYEVMFLCLFFWLLLFDVDGCVVLIFVLYMLYIFRFFWYFFGMGYVLLVVVELDLCV